MRELSAEETEAATDVKAAVFLMKEKFKVVHEISDDIRSIYNNMGGNTEFLKSYIGQIEKLKNNIADTASEIVADEIAQLAATYEVMQDDYNKKMNRMRNILYAAIAANSFILIATIITLVFTHR